ncbi:MAG: MBOAT family O-acyltransferase [Crocinitomicaceae bacterium]|nr:MBOAT family O-acyltransferase [Crocinitomicaceae bacterium]
MFFTSSGEFFVIAAYLILQLLVRRFLGNKMNKGLLLVGNIVLLSTMVTYYTLGIHVLLSLLVYLIGKQISKPSYSRAKRLTIIAVVSIIGLYCVRAYPAAFGINSFQLTSDPRSIIQRLGISYIMFRHIQFLVDSYKGKIRAYAFIDYVNFILFFPNFLAGPIDVYNNFKRWSDRQNGKIKNALILPGIGRILIGFIKKFALVPLIYASAVSYEPFLETMEPVQAILLSLVYYSLYIYLDFSGYSDIAIGSGYIMGIRTPENFKMPYLSTNIADFWRKWHITFSDFLRELIFKPIVKGMAKWKIKLPRLSVSVIGYILTFFICGIWHGDTANFVYWGLWHGVGLSIYKLWSSTTIHDKVHASLKKAKMKWFSDLVGFGITFCFVTFGWVFFHYSKQDLSDIFEILF